MNKTLKWRPIASAPKHKVLFVVLDGGGEALAVFNGSRWRTTHIITANGIYGYLEVTHSIEPKFWLDAPDPPKPKKKVTR